MLDAYPALQGVYSADDGNSQALYLKDVVATIASMGSEPKVIKFQAGVKTLVFNFCDRNNLTAPKSGVVFPKVTKKGVCGRAANSGTPVLSTYAPHGGYGIRVKLFWGLIIVRFS